LQYEYFDPNDWYWLRRNNLTVYSSKSMKEVNVTNINYQFFLKEGHIPTSYPLGEDYKTESKLSMLEVLKRYDLDNESLITKRLDDFAAEKGYDNIESLVSYVNSNIADYKNEASKGISLRDSTWKIYFDLIKDNPELYYAEIEEHLPVLSWDE
jgi:hypothetical protein